MVAIAAAEWLRVPGVAQDEVGRLHRTRPKTVDRGRELCAPQEIEGLYLSVASLAPRGEAGGEREPGQGWGDRARD